MPEITVVSLGVAGCHDCALWRCIETRMRRRRYCPPRAESGAGRLRCRVIGDVRRGHWWGVRWRRFRIATHPQETTENSVDVRIDALHMSLRVWVLPTPIDAENIDLVIGASSPHTMRPFAHLSRFFSHRIVCQEVEQDLDVWTYKTFVERPAPAKTDGPMGTYRRYVRQFYAPADAGDAVEPGPKSTHRTRREFFNGLLDSGHPQ